jgi:dephospho-CoA kinase
MGFGPLAAKKKAIWTLDAGGRCGYFVGRRRSCLAPWSLSNPKSLAFNQFTISHESNWEICVMRRLIKVGLTGGIASGKSTTLEQWREAGAAVIDADELAHEALTTDTPTWEEVVRTFGKGILNKNRTVNRPKLGEIVFADEGKREALNRIIHPSVDRMWHEEIERLASEGRAEVVAVAIPLLYEVAAESQFDCVVVVGCSEPTQLVRLTKKGLSETQARARIGAQWPLPKKMDRADFVIWNDGAPEVLHQQAEIIWATIKETYHASSKN